MLLLRPNHRALLHSMPKVVALAAIITLGAKIQVPFWPVPMTIHTLAVMAIAILAGPRIAAGAVATYLAAGAAGLPVFSGSPARGIGLAYMVGPTGGYLLGYLVAAALTGWLATGGGIVSRILAMLAGMGVIYALGAAWLCNFVPAADVWAVGVLPFLMGDLLKIGLAAGLATLWMRARGLRA
ncbi:biotin transporter BioY [Falsirhodobacter deserti]|uniref:biotin transporter BioY n=1 Tax=Falsirhodobacter deserti TaxID=1365611 RepID=UPI0013E304F3